MKELKSWIQEYIEYTEKKILKIKEIIPNHRNIKWFEGQVSMGKITLSQIKNLENNMNNIDQYIGESFSINYEKQQKRFKIFTIHTQHFYVNTLSELTPEKFEKEIQRQKETEEINKAKLKEINEYIIAKKKINE